MNFLTTCGLALAASLCLPQLALADDAKLAVGIVTFSTSDIDTNGMVDSMTNDAKARGWTVTNLNAQPAILR